MAKRSIFFGLSAHESAVKSSNTESHFYLTFWIVNISLICGKYINWPIQKYSDGILVIS